VGSIEKIKKGALIVKRKRQPAEQKSKILFVPEVSKVLGYEDEKNRAVWNMISRGQIPHRRWNGRVIVLEEELNEYLPGVTVSEALAKAEAR
jgi:hypothetical protein